MHLWARQLLQGSVGRLAVRQVKGQARRLAAHNREGDHSGLVVSLGVCDCRQPQTEVVAPAWSLHGTSQPSLLSWRFVHWGRSCCHYPEHKIDTCRYFRWTWLWRGLTVVMDWNTEERVLIPGRNKMLFFFGVSKLFNPPSFLVYGCRGFFDRG